MNTYFWSIINIVIKINVYRHCVPNYNMVYDMIITFKTNIKQIIRNKNNANNKSDQNGIYWCDS